MIRVFATGRAATEPELISEKLLKFRFASDRWTASGEEATFVTVKVLGNRATPLARIVRKGMPLTIFGELAQEEWETEAGKRSALVVIASDIVLPDKAQDETHGYPKPLPDDELDEIPF